MLLRTQTAIVRGGRDGQTWQYDGSQWVAYRRQDHRHRRTPAELVHRSRRRAAAGSWPADGRLGAMSGRALGVRRRGPAARSELPRLRDAGWGICPSCRASSPSAPSRTRPRPDPCPAGFPPTVASAPYDPLLRGLIIAHKERQALGLSRLLADRLAIACTSCSQLVVPSSYGPGGRAGPGAVGGAGRPAARLRRDPGAGPTGRAVGCGPGIRSGCCPPWLSSRSVRDQAGLDAQATPAQSGRRSPVRAPGRGSARSWSWSTIW